MTMESTKKRYRYLKDRFDVDYIDNVPDPKEVIEEELERINFSDKREDHLEDRCFRCGSEEDLILVLPKVKNDIRDYRHFKTFKGLLYKICKEPYDGPTGGKNVYKFNDFILENWDRLIEIFEEEVKANREIIKEQQNSIETLNRDVEKLMGKIEKLLEIMEGQEEDESRGVGENQKLKIYR